VTGLTSGIEYLFKKNKVDYIKGWGKFNSATEIAVDLNDGGSQIVNAEKTIIATGSEPASLPAGMLDIDEKYVVTSTGALDLQKIPKSMVVVGGGVIGLEMGSVYARLGTDVTVIQHTERICPFLDKEISASFQKILTKQGMKFKVNSRLSSGVNKKEQGVDVVIDGPKG
jgi:dihydrolipoamide dehydrogenase